MDEQVRIHYDPEIDLLEIAIGAPQEAISEEVADDIFFHYKPNTSQVVGFTVLNLRRRFETSRAAAIVPLTATFAPAHETG